MVQAGRGRPEMPELVQRRSAQRCADSECGGGWGQGVMAGAFIVRMLVRDRALAAAAAVLAACSSLQRTIDNQASIALHKQEATMGAHLLDCTVTLTVQHPSNIC